MYLSLELTLWKTWNGKSLDTAESKSFEMKITLKDWKFRVQHIPQPATAVTGLGTRVAEEFALPAAAGQKGSMRRPDSNIAVSQLRFFPILRSCLLHDRSILKTCFKVFCMVWLSWGSLQFPYAKLLLLFLLSENWNQRLVVIFKNNSEF